MTSSPAQLTIGQAAARFGLPAHVLRHWESMGLLSPARTGTDRRRYAPEHLRQIAIVVRAKQAGLSLDDIRAVVENADPAVRRRVLARHRTDLAERLARTQASLRLVDAVLDCAHEDLATCPHLQATLAAVVGEADGATAPGDACAQHADGQAGAGCSGGATRADS
ncbi:MerR family transcriptional regulator [Micromonospora sp. NPDC048909]|uniref:MerR family transcriptional regulator n=1 Tax=Micromonospora sp. NPDC048909 TaxID=3155643 RepID=UPI003411D2A4